MDTISDYFRKYTDKISFIQLKDNRSLNIEGYNIDNSTPLPVLTEDLVKEIKRGSLEEEINISNIVDGIIFILGIDEAFKHSNEYKNILISYNENIEDYIFYKGIKNIESEEYDMGAICFRALKIINPKNINNIFNYSLSLEFISKLFFAREEDETALKFINKSTLELESILDIDKSYPLAYYKLGYHYKFYQQYLKAQLIWNRYLLLEEDQIRLQEIRIEIENIGNDVILEAGLTYLAKNYFEKALEEFLKLLPKLSEWWELNYYLGLSYKGLTEYQSAIKYFNVALESNKDVSDIYNELGISYILIGEIKDAIKVLGEGIEKIEDDYKLLFNRGLAYLQINQLNQAYEDIKRAVKLNPEDENMALQKKRLEEVI